MVTIFVILQEIETKHTILITFRAREAAMESLKELTLLIYKNEPDLLESDLLVKSFKYSWFIDF